MAKKEENKPEVDKTVEELAREAMSAIKESQRAEERLEEENAKIKEHNLKQEVENKIRSKMRRVKREMEKEEKAKKPEVDTTFLATWTNPDGKGITYIGEYNEKKVFRISRGITLFHLYITGKDVLHEDWQRNAHTSMNLYNLKEKADKILKESNKKISEQKKKS